ncbi:MAG: hypothetical protein JNK23_07795 [Opitutaceae bacterium]|nr:hypothetical protein [Opitutaceae bacterium]
MKTTPFLTALLCAPLCLCAQVAPPATATPPPASAANVKIETSVSSGAQDVVKLSPFEVNTDKDNGFMAANAGTATRLSLDMADVPAAYSVMTRDFIDALGITNIQEATMWAPGGTPVPDGNGADVFGITSIAAVRGVVLVNGGSSGGTTTTRNNYLSAATQDSYNLERYDFGRGPNAALFNVGANSSLGGGMGAVTKRARYDRPIDTFATVFGSWNYKRATLDVNRPLTDKLAVRANAVWFDRDGWKRRETEQVKGITGSLSYLWRPKTEVRLEVSREKTMRSIPQTSLYDTFTGWDGVTVFREPFSNAIQGTQALPGVPTSLGHVLRFQGEAQGVDRRAGAYYVWSPWSGQNVLMNYQNEAITRAGDATANTPIYGNGRLWTRGTGLPFGNSAAQTTTPGINAGNGGGNLNLLYQDDLPADRFNRVLAGSKFRLPDKRDNNTTDAPTLLQNAKDINLALTHQIGTSWFFELGGDVNRTTDRRVSVNDFRALRIDINQLLPNGVANPNYLQPYADGTIAYSPVRITNSALRMNVAYRGDYGKWGNYVVNFNTGITHKETLSTTFQRSMRVSADPRMWTGGDDLIRVRHYFYAPSRPFSEEGVPTQVFRRDFSADNNSFSTSTATFTPDWVASTWTRSENRFIASGLAASAKYFGGKLVVLPAIRFDNVRAQVWNSINRADLPADWDGRTFYYRPDAPSDWINLSYIPRSATGAPTSTIPIPAATRPRTAIPTPAGATTNNGIAVPNAFHLNDRFRDDYNPPVNKRQPYSISTGAVYHLAKWVSVVGNYATSYVLPPTGAFDISNDLADVQTGKGYDGGFRFNFLNSRLTANINYFFNTQDKARVTPPTNGPINALYGRNAATDGAVGSRNNLGLADIFGGDYQSQRNSGAEFEIIAALKNGLRLTFNGGVSRLVTYDRYPLSRKYVPENAANFLKVLEAAGGRLDTTRKPAGAPNAPGLAVVNPAVTAAIVTEQTNAVTDYNNLWVQYEGVLSDAPSYGVKRFNSNIYADYTIQEGRLRGLRVGLGLQYRGDGIAGYRTGDSELNAAGQVVAKYADGRQHPIYTAQPLNSVASLAYTMRLKDGWRLLANKQVSFQLNIRNLLNRQRIIYQDDTVVPRAPGGDFSIPYRVSVPAKNAIYQEPISFLFTTTLRL